ncbi:MAG: CPBP family intramembrane glutamic endopeptidase [Clostridia bacterium]
MKRFFSALSRGVIFALLYVGMQFIVSIFATIGFGIFYAMANTTDIGLDVLEMQSSMADFVMQNSNMITMISNLLTLVVLMIIFRATRKRYSEQISLLPVQVSKLWPVVVMGAAMTFVVTAGMDMLPIPEQWWESYEQLSSTLVAGSPIIAFVSTVIVAPVVEEVVFRGLVYTRLRSGMPFIVAMLLECAIFAVLHGTAIWIAYAFLLAILMTLVFEAYGSIWASIALHITFNLFGSYVTPYMQFKSQLIPLLAGLVIAAVCARFIMINRNGRRVREGK